MENRASMRRSLVAALAGVLALLAAPVGSAAEAKKENARLFVGGTTPLTSGYFFPGAGVYNGERYQYVEPLQVTKGTNVELTNLDEEAVANAHQVRSLKKNKKTKRPLFASKPVRHPGDTVIIRTKRLKPGKYAYICTTHTGMTGMLQIVRK